MLNKLKLNCLWESCSSLGESPLWCSETQTLFFVDIKKHKILSWAMDGTQSQYSMPSEVGCVVRGKGNVLYAAIREGLAEVSLNPFSSRLILPLESEQPDNRFNDGKCDHEGRLWLASMDDNEIEASGAVWKITQGLQAKKVSQGFIVGNGFGWSPDGRTMYFTDSAQRKIYAYPYNMKKGVMGEQHVFATIPDNRGFPDGLTVDADGYVWSCHWDGACITRYSGNGIIDEVIELPVPRPTSVTFGGDNYESLFITSASYGLNKAELQKAPLSGSLFSLDVGIKGFEEPVFSRVNNVIEDGGEDEFA